MIIDFKSQLVSSTEEILDIHIEWSPAIQDEESKAALIATFLDTIKKLVLLEKVVNE